MDVQVGFDPCSRKLTIFTISKFSHGPVLSSQSGPSAEVT